jgi:hypothetical protein
METYRTKLRTKTASHVTVREALSIWAEIAGLQGEVTMTLSPFSTDALPDASTEPGPLNIAAVRCLLEAAFTDSELRIFCHDSPDLREILLTFGSDAPVRDMVEAVITYCEKQLLLPKLLTQVEAHNPRQYARYASSIYSRDAAPYTPVPVSPLPADYTQPLSQGLLALAQLMQSPVVRSAVAAFRADFEATREQVGAVGNYKDMHDLLHKLQLQCYNPILQEARRFPDDEIARENLEDYGFTLEGIIEELKQTASRASFASHETAWIEELSQAGRELARATQEADAKRLRRAILLVKRVLDLQLSQINTRLNDKARALRLAVLMDRMSCVRDSLDHPGLPAERISQFEAGLESLDGLNQRLMGLVREHDLWQNVDSELRMIESFLEQMDELELLWDGITEKTRLVCTDNREAWATSMGRISVDLEGAIGARDPVNVRRHFRRFRREMDNRFYQVDSSLKGLCDELRQVGEPLDSILEIMEG